MTGKNLKRVVLTKSALQQAPADQVFPLLCPAREYDWIPGWTCDLHYSESGHSEDNVVFTTQRESGTQYWVATRYEPNNIVHYQIVAPPYMIFRLNLSVEDHGNDTSTITWTRIYTVLDKRGLDFVPSEDVFNDEISSLQAMMDYYLKHGEMIPESDSNFEDEGFKKFLRRMK